MSYTFGEAITTGPASQQTQQDDTQRHAKERWGNHRLSIEDMYLRKGMTLKNIAHFLKTDHGFPVTERQLKRKVHDWRLDKNVKGDEMRFIEGKQRRRKAEGKETIFYIRGHTVLEAKIERWRKKEITRKIVLESAESSATPTTPADITYHSPFDTGPPSPELEPKKLPRHGDHTSELNPLKQSDDSQHDQPSSPQQKYQHSTSFPTPGRNMLKCPKTSAPHRNLSNGFSEASVLSATRPNQNHNLSWQQTPTARRLFTQPVKRHKGGMKSPAPPLEKISLFPQQNFTNILPHATQPHATRPKSTLSIITLATQEDSGTTNNQHPESTAMEVDSSSMSPRSPSCTLTPSSTNAEIRSIEARLRQVAEERQNTLGRKYPKTLEAFLDLAAFMLLQGNIDAAEQICTEYSSILPPAHSISLKFTDIYANCLIRQGNHSSAFGILQDALVKRKIGRNEADLYVLDAMESLALLYKSQEKYFDCFDLLREIYDLNVEYRGQENVWTLRSECMVRQAGHLWTAHISSDSSGDSSSRELSNEMEEG